MVAWGLAVRAAPSGTGRLNDLLSVLFLAPPLASTFVLWTLFRIRLGPMQGLAAACLAYLILGAIYAAARPAGQIASVPGRVFFWPTLILWQDVCRTGLWPCPAD